MPNRRSRKKIPQAGAEPANDLRRRFVAAFEEVGLNVRQSSALIPNKMIDWFVYAVAPAPHADPNFSAIAVDAIVSPSGAVIQKPHLHATIRIPGRGDFVVMDGRDELEVPGLVGALQETIREFQIVSADLGSLRNGPRLFSRTQWRLINPISKLPC